MQDNLSEGPLSVHRLVDPLGQRGSVSLGRKRMVGAVQHHARIGKHLTHTTRLVLPLGALEQQVFDGAVHPDHPRPGFGLRVELDHPLCPLQQAEDRFLGLGDTGALQLLRRHSARL